MLRRNLLFDLDGTLTDPKDGIVRSINYALRKFGLPDSEPSAIDPFIGPPLKDTFRALLNTDDGETLNQAVAWYRERYVVKGYIENKVYDGIPELLLACREEGHQLFVATSKRKDIARQVLDHFGLSQHLEAVYGCDVDLSKTELLSILMGEQGLDASACVMIGDRRHEVEAARPNGIPAVGVLWGYGSIDELTAAGAGFIVRTPADLLRVIGDSETRIS